MGEARRRRLQQLAAEQELHKVDLPALSKALHKVVSAITTQSGSDCIQYAEVGAEVLNRLGADAKFVAGEAAWRVGPGASDVISHMIAPNTSYFAPVGAPALTFHAWIEMPAAGYILDFTTRTLKRKAQLLDAADGGHTAVDWAPEYLAVARSSCAKPSAVIGGYVAGLYCYQPSEELTLRVLASAQGDDPAGHAATVARLADATAIAYNQARRGIDVKVFGVGAEDEEHQHEDNAPSPPLRPL